MFRYALRKRPLGFGFRRFYATHPDDQTIYSLSSGAPKSAVAIIRVSGSQASKVIQSLIC